MVQRLVGKLIMKVLAELDVKNCNDCPFRNYHYGHGECWYECRHKDAPKAYGSIIHGGGESFKGTPKWCPLGLSNDTDEARSKTKGEL